ncbi:PLP-dependent transferase [Fusarium oxysporum Fo47]|uniref:PLP-dependent transferase n=1 Tax=Fusarium oxysporum Fo47 TaxID=660027 RepID=UPI002869C7FF|nr:PLP-dependent transferase [Fusarium oxysporum Fo47]QKD53932.2 PLP-dependent transferase [Fusarium oxysporum Fo47]
MHSGIKYIGGHSDMLCGVLSFRPDIEATESWIDKSRGERVSLGSVMASLGGWLGVWIRSAGFLINRLPTSAKELGPVGEVVAQGESSWLRKQIPHGYDGVFALVIKDERLARRLPIRLYLLHHATNRGGVESLIKWRALLDQSIDCCLLRINVGVEH